ncbi:MAG TPA: MMPL family transporter, partial [Cryobacterium sp.]|nr:MMPL family transporter [Cryobacterium sp.]
GPVESFVPVMLFAVLFGLSTDYTVFLLSRVKEELARTGDANRAVRDGLAATARVILAAASVMVVVFGSFILNDQRTVTMFGFGLAMSVAVYALVVMLVLVPALLAIAGRGAWGRTTRGSSAAGEADPDRGSESGAGSGSGSGSASGSATGPGSASGSDSAREPAPLLQP